MLLELVIWAMLISLFEFVKLITYGRLWCVLENLKITWGQLRIIRARSVMHECGSNRWEISLIYNIGIPTHNSHTRKGKLSKMWIVLRYVTCMACHLNCVFACLDWVFFWVCGFVCFVLLITKRIFLVSKACHKHVTTTIWIFVTFQALPP